MAGDCRRQVEAPDSSDVLATRSEDDSLVTSPQSKGMKVLGTLSDYQRKVSEAMEAAVPSQLDPEQLAELDMMHHYFRSSIQDLEKAIRILCNIPAWKSDIESRMDEASSSVPSCSSTAFAEDSEGETAALEHQLAILKQGDASALEDQLAILQALGLQAAVRVTSTVLASLPSTATAHLDLAHFKAEPSDEASETSTRITVFSGSGSIASSSALEIKRSRVMEAKNVRPEIPSVAVVPLYDDGELGETLLEVPRLRKNSNPTALKVKEVVAEELGLPSASDVRLVIRSNGFCVAHRDEDFIRSNRVFVVGLDHILPRVQWSRNSSQG